MPRDNDPLVYRGPTSYSFGPTEEEKNKELLAAQAALIDMANGKKGSDDLSSTIEAPEIFKAVSKAYEKQAIKGNVFTPEEIEELKQAELDRKNAELNTLPVGQTSFMRYDPLSSMTKEDVIRFNELIKFLKETKKYKLASPEVQQKMIDDTLLDTAATARKIRPELPLDQRIGLKLGQ